MLSAQHDRDLNVSVKILNKDLSATINTDKYGRTYGNLGLCKKRKVQFSQIWCKTKPRHVVIFKTGLP